LPLPAPGQTGRVKAVKAVFFSCLSKGFKFGADFCGFLGELLQLLDPVLFLSYQIKKLEVF
jgi:hypothetical protein